MNCFRFNQVSAAEKIKIAAHKGITHGRNGVEVRERSPRSLRTEVPDNSVGRRVAQLNVLVLASCRLIRRGLSFSLFGMVISQFATCLHGHRGGAYGGVYSAVVFAWRKGVASAQRSDLTSEEAKRVRQQQFVDH